MKVTYTVPLPRITPTGVPWVHRERYEEAAHTINSGDKVLASRALPSTGFYKRGEGKSAHLGLEKTTTSQRARRAGWRRSEGPSPFSILPQAARPQSERGAACEAGTGHSGLGGSPLGGRAQAVDSDAPGLPSHTCRSLSVPLCGADFTSELQTIHVGSRDDTPWRGGVVKDTIPHLLHSDKYSIQLQHMP